MAPVAWGRGWLEDSVTGLGAGRAVTVSALGDGCDAGQWLEQCQSMGASRLLLWLWGRAHGDQASHEPSGK